CKSTPSERRGYYPRIRKAEQKVKALKGIRKVRRIQVHPATVVIHVEQALSLPSDQGPRIDWPTHWPRDKRQLCQRVGKGSTRLKKRNSHEAIDRRIDRRCTACRSRRHVAGVEPPGSTGYHQVAQGRRYRFLHVSELRGRTLRLHHAARQLCAAAGRLRRPELLHPGSRRSV